MIGWDLEWKLSELGNISQNNEYHILLHCSFNEFHELKSIMYYIYIYIGVHYFYDIINYLYTVTV